MVNDLIEREITIAAPVERVWALITEAEHIGRWFGDAGATVDLRPGGAMAFHWKEHGTALAEVVAIERPRRFAYRWVPVPGVRNVAPTVGNSTLVEFTLEPDGDGTRLRVVESGFASLEIAEDQQLEAVEGNTRGWGMELQDLVDYATRVAA